MKRPYVRKLKHMGDITVFLVDGKYVRENLSKEFTNFGQFHKFPFIPHDEIWIDRERNPNEEEFFIDSMLSIRNSLEAGKSYEDAVKKADRVEKKERMSSEFAKEYKKMHKDDLLDEIRKKKIMDFGRFSVWIVNGKIVRDIYFLDFTEGGHDKVYPFVPPDEIWIDDDLSTKEIYPVILHEIFERFLMVLGLSYNFAHYRASTIEWFCRKNTFFLKPLLYIFGILNRIVGR